MVIKNRTILSSAEVKESLVLLAKKNYKSRFFLSGMIGIFGLLIVILVSTSGNAADTLTIGISFLIFACIFFVMNIISYFSLPKKIEKKNKEIIAFGIENLFTFKEESFILQSKIAGVPRKLEASYTDLRKIIEEEDCIRFVVSATEEYICKKNGFQTPKEMDIFFYGLSKHKTKIKKNIKE